MTPDDHHSRAQDLMEAFAVETGLTEESPPRRYLWTDAFAVCNYLGLYRATGRDRYRELAVRLVDQVHRILGRHREDDPREGWLSGLPEERATLRPTAGGLRIGKSRPDRAPGDPLRPDEEWQRDGQYYHYLTRWMHALNQTWKVTGSVRYFRWAIELALVAHEAFHRGEGPAAGLHWKMSVDLSRPVLPSSGAHDPLDGLLTSCALRAAAPPIPEQVEPPDEEGREYAGPAVPSALRRLEAVVDELDEMCAGQSWTTDDPLGAGGLLVDGWRALVLRAGGELPRKGFEVSVLEDTAASLEAVAGSGVLDRGVERRLAFRELGLAVGLAAARRSVSAFGGKEGGPLRIFGGGAPLPDSVASRLRPHLELRNRIEEFWSRPEHRDHSAWSEHLDISRVMLATSLAPGGYLGDPPED